MTITPSFVIIKPKTNFNHTFLKYHLAIIKSLFKQERIFAILLAIFLFLAVAYSLWRALVLSIAHDADLYFWSSLLTEQPELFYSINYQPSLKARGIILTSIIGLSFLLAAALIIYLNKFHGLFKKLGLAILAVFLLHWSPLYFNSLYNNLRDFSANLNILGASAAEKRKERLCSMDYNQELQGKICQTVYLTDFIKKNLPKESSLAILVYPGFEPYFNYELADSFAINGRPGQADYLIAYLSNDYYYRDGALYQKNTAGQDGYGNNAPTDKKIGAYRIVKFFNPLVFILKSDK